MQITLVDEWPELPRDGDSDPRFSGHPDSALLVPMVHQLLVNPTVPARVPRFRKDTPFEHAQPYWEAGWYIARYLLGWRDPGLGFQWWYRENLATFDDPRLDLLAKGWNANGQLDLLALWTWTQPDRALVPEHVDASSYRSTRPESFLGGSWFASFQERFPGFRMPYDHDPYHGGENPLHLGHSCPIGFGESRIDGFLSVTPQQERRAVVMLESARHWYRALDRLGSELPTLGERSWHVDVVVKPLGWLGTFRKSRITGQWFQGKHSIHQAGNPPAAKKAT